MPGETTKRETEAVPSGASIRPTTEAEKRRFEEIQRAKEALHAAAAKTTGPAPTTSLTGFMATGETNRERKNKAMVRADPVLTTRQGRRRATREGK